MCASVAINLGKEALGLGVLHFRGDFNRIPDLRAVACT